MVDVEPDRDLSIAYVAFTRHRDDVLAVVSIADIASGPAISPNDSLMWPRRSDTPTDEEDELQRATELDKPNLRGYPEVFEYAEFNGEPWDSVHTSKQLFVRLMDKLCAIDEAKLAASEYGRYVKDAPDRGFSYAQLANGKWLYTGLWHQYLLDVVQSLVTEFGLEDSVRVKLAPVQDA